MCAARRSSIEWTFLVVALLGGFLTLFQMFLVPEIEDESQITETSEINAPVILWWTSSFGHDERYKVCGDKRCYFTKKRSNSAHPRLGAIMFYGSNVELRDLPLPRAKNVQWALLHEESPRNRPMFVHKEALELFNYSATFSRYSDLPLTLVFLPGEKELLDTKYYMPVKEKNELLVAKKLAPVLYIQSDCDTANDRDSYVAELMKHIPVDSYGACLNNRQFPERLRGNYVNQLESEEFFAFVAQYKFTISFENAVCDDYITEKLWRPLLVGSVPIYYGSPSFKDWLPNNESAIDVRDFDQPSDLANFLLNLNDDDARYEKYLAHKLSDPKTALSNDRLLNSLRSRPSDMHSVFEHSVRSFECLVCEKLHDTRSVSTVSTKQYNCPLPENMLPSRRNQQNAWVYQWLIDKCAAKLLSQHVLNGTKIDYELFKENIFSMFRRNEC